MRFSVSAIALLLPALLASSAFGGMHQVWDEAHFFKVETIERVDQTLAEIRQQFKKDLMIETFPSIPDDLKDKLKQQGKENFFKGWTRSEADRLNVHGIIILITGDPAHLQVEVGLKTSQQAFTLSDNDELVAKLVEAFRRKDYDNGLIEAAKFVQERLEKNAGGGATTRPAAPATQQAGRSNHYPNGDLHDSPTNPAILAAGAAAPGAVRLPRSGRCQ